MIIFFDGNFIEDQPILTIHNRFRLGEGVFNTILVIDGHIVHAMRHTEKLLKNSEYFFGDWKKPQAQYLIEKAQQLLAKNNFTLGRYALNMMISGGDAGNGIRTPENITPQIIMRALPCPEDFPPVHAIIAENLRRNEGSPLSNFKCSNYGDNIIALREAENKGANEAIMLTNTGHVSCATTSNIVMIRGHEIITPPLSDGPQAGVTRTILMEKYDVIERSILPKELLESDGLYLINSLRGAIPIQTLNKKNLPPPALEIDKDFAIP